MSTSSVIWNLPVPAQGAYTQLELTRVLSRSGAEWYENEADCGRAIKDFIKESGVPREDIWFTTKLYAPATPLSSLRLAAC